MKSGGNTKLWLSSLYRGGSLIKKKNTEKERKTMGKMIAREIDNLTWRVAGCLLFIGISAPAFHKFYRNGIEH